MTWGRGEWRSATRLCAVVIALWATVAPASSTAPFPAWAFAPLGRQASAGRPANETPLHVPGSRRAFTRAEVDDPYAPPDWFPERHPPAPAIVLAGSRPGKAWACGYCHLPDGSGRPENATLAGLSVSYIRNQLVAFRTGERKGALPDWSPSHRMATVTGQMTEAEIGATADYFASIPYRGHVRVKETARISGVVGEGYLLRLAPGPGEPLGARIVEGPTSIDRFELRDPTVSYTALVSPGSLARGAALARSGTPGLATPCAACHGVGLRGGRVGAVGPALAGRSPTYLFRELYAFQTGARAGDAAEPMRQATAGLSQGDLIALAAHAASLRP
jgi:cytochrome c553